MYCARSHRGEDRRVRTLYRASRRSPSQDMIGGRYVDDEVLRVVAHDGAHRSGNKNCSRLGIKRLVFDQANLLVACLLVRVANLDPRGFLACPLRRLLRRLGYLVGLLGPSPASCQIPARKPQAVPTGPRRGAHSIHQSTLLISTFPRSTGQSCTRSIPEMRSGHDWRSESEWPPGYCCGGGGRG